MKNEKSEFFEKILSCPICRKYLALSMISPIRCPGLSYNGKGQQIVSNGKLWSDIVKKYEKEEKCRNEKYYSKHKKHLDSHYYSLNAHSHTRSREEKQLNETKQEMIIKMLKECWKVTQNGFSLTRYSLQGISVEYKLGQTAQPTMGKIFCFSNKLDLIKFIELNYDDWERDELVVFRGTAENPVKVNRVAQMGRIYRDQFEDLKIPSSLRPNYEIAKAIVYWQLKRKKKKVPESLTKLAPPGTISTCAFIPTEQYNWSEFLKLEEGESK